VASSRVDEIIGTIRDSGGRVTQARRLVVERIVEGGDHHLTAPELIDDLRVGDPDFHESTVYRVLELLTELNIVVPVSVQSGATVFHLTDDAHTHHHLLCSGCGSVTETDGSLLDAVATDVERRHGFALAVDSPTTLLGRCAACRAADG